MDQYLNFQERKIKTILNLITKIEIVAVTARNSIHFSNLNYPNYIKIISAYKDRINLIAASVRT